MKPRIFIDGQEGTTGIQIYDRLGNRDDIELMLIDEGKRKDTAERAKLLNAADIAFLCLPDAAAKEAVTLIKNDNTRVIDASTAHRTDPNWVYGFPELSKAHRDRIATAKRVANPGCHASGIIAATYPLIIMGIMPKDYPLTCFSLTGYSGGGKTMINAYEQAKTDEMQSPRIYGLDLAHKHIPEIVYITGLTRTPVFCPVVDDYYAGMATTISMHNYMLNGKPSAKTLRERLAEYYVSERFINVTDELGSGTLESNWGVGTNDMELTVSGNDDLSIITARFDNLGKGASGAAVQNMELMLNI